jgi:hypothetical protein
MSNLRYKRIVRVGVGKHGTNGKKHFRDGESRAPLVSQDVQADAAIGVDIGVVDASGEVNLWWLERVVGREMDSKEEDTTGVW